MVAGQPELDTVSIKSVTVDGYLSVRNHKNWMITSDNSSAPIRSITIMLTRAVDAVLTVDESLIGQSVIIQRGETTATEEYVFRGEVTQVEPKATMYLITCADRLYESTKVKVTRTFLSGSSPEAGVFSEIAKTLLTDYSSLTYSSTSIQNSGTTRIATTFRCKGVSLYDRLKLIAETLGWNLFYNPNDNEIHLEPKGYVNQSTIIQTQTNILEKPSWTIDSEQLYNKVEVQGGTQEVQTTEIGQIGVTSGYTTTSVTLTQKPTSTKVYVDASNPPTTLKTGGVNQSTSTFDYSVDVDNKQILWNTSQYTPTTNHYCKTEYTYKIPLISLVQDNVSIASYCPTRIPKSISLKKSELVVSEDVDNYALQYLQIHKDPIYTTKIKVTNVSDLSVNQKVYINDTANGISGYFYVTSVTKSSPYRYDEITVSSQILTEADFDWNTQQRIKRLEEEQTTDSDLTNQIFPVYRTTRMKRKYSQVIYEDLDGAAVYGIPLYGTVYYGTPSTTTTVSIVQGNNEYEENIVSNTFYDSTNSTGTTWNTTTQQITINNSGILYTTAIALGHKFNYITLTLNNPSDPGLTLEVSANGKTNWQTVSSGARTLLTNSNTTGIYIRITNSTGSAVTIDNLYDSNSKYSKPAIDLLMED